MGYILSCTTTPKRIEKLVQVIPHIKPKYKYFVINICEEYRRFGKFKLPKSIVFIESFTPYISGAGKILKRRLMEDYGDKVDN